MSASHVAHPVEPAAVPDRKADRPLRILHLVARSHRRGAEIAALELAAALDDLGHENRVVALGAADSGGHETELPPLVDTSGLGPFDLVPRIRRLRRLLVDEPVDAVLAHGGWAAQVAALAAPRRRPLLVWQRIGGLSPNVWRPSRQWWWRSVTRRFDVGIALTGELEDELRRLGFAGPVWTIPNSREPGRFLGLDRDEAARSLRAELGIGEDVHVVAFVGHLDPKKRADRALDVHERVLALGGRAHLVVVGDGPLRAELERDARARGLAGHVSFVGRRTDVERILAGSDLLVLTSDLEGIPGVAIESLMAGCPVVSVPVGGVAEVIDDGVTGVLMPDADGDGMAATVVSLLGDDGRRAAMSAAGRRQVERFSTQATAKVYSDSLVAALARP